MNDLLVEAGNAFAQLAGLDAEHFDVIVVGGGQAGLSVGYHLKRLGVRFVILDANARIGDAWRKRWDSLRLFTPAWLDGLDGLPFPGTARCCPTKDQMADYLESYAAHFALPVRTSHQVDAPDANENGASSCSAATSSSHAGPGDHRHGQLPEAEAAGVRRQLRSDIVQLHSSEYKSPAQLVPGAALVVGGGNSGAEIAIELVRTRAVRMAGRDVGPCRSGASRWLGTACSRAARVVFHRLLTIRNPLGRKARRRCMHSGHAADPRQARRSRSAPVSTCSCSASPACATGCRCSKTARCSTCRT